MRCSLRPFGSPLQTVLEKEVSIDGGRIETEDREHCANHGKRKLTITAIGMVETQGGEGAMGKVCGRAHFGIFNSARR